MSRARRPTLTPSDAASSPWRGFTLVAWLTLLRSSVEQFVRGRRLLVLGRCSPLPTVIAVLAALR